MSRRIWRDVTPGVGEGERAGCLGRDTGHLPRFIVGYTSRTRARTLMPVGTVAERQCEIEHDTATANPVRTGDAKSEVSPTREIARLPVHTTEGGYKND